jgi:hypothetical protein
MRCTIFVCIVAFALLTTACCEAGGFFRRVPEVGKWARYEFTQDHTTDPGIPSGSSERRTGFMVVKCVGEEMIGERRCLWIETCHDMEVAPGIDFHAVNKVLVPEDVLLLDTPSNEFIRGWQSEMNRAPVELTFSSDDQNTEEMASTASMSSRTIVVNEEEIELTSSETWRQPTQEDDGRFESSERTFWLHDDLAFGVASMDFVSRYVTFGERGHTTLNEIRNDLVETGTGAVSELPNHD